MLRANDIVMYVREGGVGRVGELGIIRSISSDNNSLDVYFISGHTLVCVAPDSVRAINPREFQALRQLQEKPGYTRTSDGFLTNPKNWEKRLI